MSISEKQKSKVLVIGFVGAVMLVIVLYFHFMIGRAKVRDYNRGVDKLNKEIAAGRHDLKEIKELLGHEEELQEKREMIEKVTRRLPSSPDAPGFLMELISVLRKTGIYHESVKPEGPKDRSQYTEIPYTISAHGRYHELGQFLTLIEQNPQRFMRIKTFTINNNLERPSIHPITMRIATFMFNE